MLRNWFRRPSADDTYAVEITDEPEYMPAVEVSGVEMAIPVRKLAALFVEQGWQLAIDGKRPKEADPDDIKAVIAGLIDTLATSPDVTYATGFRFLMLRDQDYTSDFDLYLYAGRVTLADMEDEAE
ncbi:hypothetical protein [Micromonospora coerulea]|uniref:hypothetical protein n=1 Tax=Micromonospora coerulea TaxID=47856 RepID=UPI001906F54B|nr:hypothetical protein [Micromonospora veneta]